MQELEQLKVKWTGIRPMIMHNSRLSDPLDSYSKDLKRLNAKRKKEDPDHEEIALTEWEGGLYWDDDVGPIIPPDNIEAVIRSGAKKQKRGKDVQAAVFVSDDTVKLEYNGPRTKDGLYASDSFKIRNSVKVQQNRVMRTRPMFPTGWSITFTVEFDPSIISREALIEAMITAGALCGLNDWRPKFGRFMVEVL